MLPRTIAFLMLALPMASLPQPCERPGDDGNLIISYQFMTIDGEGGCAWSETGELWLQLAYEDEGVDPDTRYTEIRTYPCDDAPIVVEGLKAGAWWVELQDYDPMSDPFQYCRVFQSSGVWVDIEAAGDAAGVDVALQCMELSCDDGCGGA